MDPLASANGVSVLYRQQTGSDFISLGIVRNFVKRTEAARIEIIKLLNYISCWHSSDESYSVVGCCSVVRVVV